MSEINIGQFVNRFLNLATGAKPDARPEPSGFETATKVAQEAVVLVRNQGLNNVLLQQQQYQETMQLARLNTLERCMMLKELFNLPKDVKEFLLMMSTDPSVSVLNAKDLANTLLVNNLDVAKLLTYLQHSGKEALSKLFQMVASFNQMGTALKSADIKELTTLINACVPGSSISDNQVIKNVLLMYLPWFSLNGAVNFDLDVASASAGGGEDSDDSINILISTENFGNLQITIFKSKQDEINMHVSCSKDFPKKELKQEINLASKDYNVVVSIGFSEVENSSKENKEQKKPQVSMTTTTNSNPFLILLAQMVIKSVVKMDKSFSLRETRRQRLDE